MTTQSIEMAIMAQVKSTLVAALGPAGTLGTWLVTTDYELVRNDFTQFNESELPAIQLFDGAPATCRHQNRYVEKEWPVYFELVMKSSKDLLIDQAALFSRLRDMENAISADLHLGGQIEGFRHLRYDGYESDLHTTPGYFAVAMRMTALFQQPFPGG